MFTEIIIIAFICGLIGILTKSKVSQTDKVGKPSQLKSIRGMFMEFLEAAQITTAPPPPPHGGESKPLQSTEGTGMDRPTAWGSLDKSLQTSEGLGSRPPLAWGSLVAATTEGIDPCHDDMYASSLDVLSPTWEDDAGSTTAEAAPSTGAVAGLSGQALVQAIVMNEILTRPQDRKRRWNR